jgi:DNA-directed RNA polymerase specialized sigma24 family protein
MHNDFHKRLSSISTLWTVVRQAHGGPRRAIAAAQRQLIDRYGGAVRRYLLAVLRDEDATDELFQEFALRFVRGDLRGADPSRGRFRDYIKGVLFHLVSDYHRRLRDQPRPLSARAAEIAFRMPEPPEHEREARECWRDELLARCWARLEEVEQTSDQPLYTVLRHRADHPERRSPQLAEALSTRLRRPLSPAAVRQLLHRARRRFAELLVDEVVHSLHQPSPQDVEEELGELGLLEYARPILRGRG